MLARQDSPDFAYALLINTEGEVMIGFGPQFDDEHIPALHDAVAAVEATLRASTG